MKRKLVILLFIKKQTDFEYSVQKRRGRDMVVIDSIGLTPSRHKWEEKRIVRSNAKFGPNKIRNTNIKEWKKDYRKKRRC